MGDVIEILTTATNTVEVEAQGPQGIPGVGVPTGGSTGQVLRKASSADYATEWAAAGSGSGSVTSVALASSDFTISGSPITDAGTITANLGNTGVTAGTYTKVTVDEKGRVTTAETATPADISAQGAFQYEEFTITGNVTLNAARAKYYAISTTSAVTANVVLPTGQLVGDRIIIVANSPWNNSSVINIEPIADAYSIAQITTNITSVEFIAIGTAAGAWSRIDPVIHVHAANEITSGTLAHERGGLEADVSAYSGLVKISGGSTSAVTVTAAGEALLDDATNADQRTTLGLGTAATANLGTGASDAAYGNHTHADLHTRSHAITSTSDHTAGNHKVFYSNGSGEIVELALGNSGEVLTSNGATSAPSFAAASGGDTVSIDTTAADVLSATSGAISADDGGTIDSSDPFIKWDDTAGKLVYANPLSRPAGAFYVGLAPTTTALGSNAVNVQGSRSAATQVASGDNSVCVGPNARSGGAQAVAIGLDSVTTGANAVGVGRGAVASGNDSCCYGRGASSSGASSMALGFNSFVTATKAVGAGNAVVADLRAQFATLPFGAVYWGGQTTNNTATILTLDASGTASDRFTIAANTALAVDILLVARRSDTADKWLVARRFLGIRRDGSNNTSLIGSVQTLGTDQSDGSPTWTFTLTADDTNEALQLEVTGAASETVQWRATAFYRVV